MFGYPKLRKADIPNDKREIFARYGETGLQLMIIGGIHPALPDLVDIYQNKDSVKQAQDWLTERADERARHEWRMELLEWAILIFLIIGVFADLSLAFHWFN